MSILGSRLGRLSVVTKDLDENRTMTVARRLEGRNCLIIGGTGGIGRACARRFIAEGARVIVTGRTPEETLDSFEEIGHFDSIVMDCNEEGSVESGFSAALERFGGQLDILLHVAGISGRSFGDGPLHECSTQGWETVIETNATGVFLTNRSAVRQMLVQEVDASGLRGTIVNVGSILATSPSPRWFGTLAYAASKGAVQALTLASASRYAPDRIRFSLLVPGLIETPMAERAVKNPEIQRYLVGKQPMREGPGSAEDCAEGALFLCEPASRFVTGAVLEVAGGWSISEGGQTSP